MLKRILIFILISFFSLLQASTIKQFFEKYNNIKTFSANYIQYYTPKTTKKIITKQGEMFYKTPSFIRIDTFLGKKLDQQTFISKNKTVFIYHSKKNALIKKNAVNLNAYLVFLKGLKEIKKQFKIKDSTTGIEKAKKAGLKIDKGASLLKLIPKKTIPNLKYVFLIMKNNEVTSVVIIDSMFNLNQFVFSKIKYNNKIKTSFFEAKIPKNYYKSVF